MFDGMNEPSRFQSEPPAEVLQLHNPALHNQTVATRPKRMKYRKSGDANRLRVAVRHVAIRPPFDSLLQLLASYIRLSGPAATHHVTEEEILSELAESYLVSKIKVITGLSAGEIATRMRDGEEFSWSLPVCRCAGRKCTCDPSPKLLVRTAVAQ